ncbi:hypothetical protein ACI65C_004325 [Semiaphis heraclei]
MGVCFSCFCCRRKTEPDTLGCIQNNMPPVPGVVSVPVPTVPIRNSMPLKTEQWYFRKMSRIEAEKYLLSHVNSHRSMIIRDSETSKNAYSLSVRYGNIVYHYRIKKIHSSFFIVENIKFKNLRGLVEHYSKVLSKLQASGVESDEPLIETMQSKNVVNHFIHWQFISSQIKKARNLRPGTFGFKTLKTSKLFLILNEKKGDTMEKKIMKIHTHSILIQLYAICTMKMPIYIISEFMKNGSLFDFLQGKGLSLKLQQSMYISVQKGSGIHHLEYNNYIHHTLVSRYDHIEKNSIVKIKYYCIHKLLNLLIGVPKLSTIIITSRSPNKRTGNVVSAAAMTSCGEGAMPGFDLSLLPLLCALRVCESCHRRLLSLCLSSLLHPRLSPVPWVPVSLKLLSSQDVFHPQPGPQLDPLSQILPGPTNLGKPNSFLPPL